MESGTTPLHRALVGALVFLMPMLSRSFTQPRGITLWLLATGVLLAATVVSSVRVFASRPTTGPNYASWLLVGFMFSFAIGYAFHPSWPGMILTISALAAGGVGLPLTQFNRREIQRWVVLPLLAAALVQAVVVWGQVITRSGWISNVIEPDRLILVTQGVVRPHGLMFHVYEPPALALLAIGAAFSAFPKRGRLRHFFTIGVGLSSTIIALTHSRSALIGLFLVVAVIGFDTLRGHRDMAVPLAVAVGAFLIPAMIFSAGWTQRFDDSLSPDLDDATLGRITLMSQAIRLSVDHPIVGVGPNRYVNVLQREQGLDPRYPWIVHSVPLAIAAELGIPAAIVITALLVATGAQSYRVGPRSLALYVAPAGFLLFDVLHYNRPVGLVMFGIWAGLLASIWASNSPGSRHRMATPH